MRTLIKICAMVVIGSMLMTDGAYALSPKYWNAPVLREAPKGHHVVRHGRQDYVFHEGRFYRHDGGRIIVVAPPFGAIVPVLPIIGMATLVVAGITFYEMNGLYYRRVPEGYIVVEEPLRPPEIIERQPPVYMQRSDQQQDTQNYWYYCRKQDGYYPYVKQCPEGWMKVVPNATPPDAGTGSNIPPDTRR